MEECANYWIVFDWLYSSLNVVMVINPLNTGLNPTYHLLALGAHPILHISRIRVKSRRVYVCTKLSQAKTQPPEILMKFGEVQPFIQVKQHADFLDL
jgi:hypothetical protein